MLIGYSIAQEEPAEIKRPITIYLATLIIGLSGLLAIALGTYIAAQDRSQEIIVFQVVFSIYFLTQGFIFLLLTYPLYLGSTRASGVIMANGFLITLFPALLGVSTYMEAPVGSLMYVAYGATLIGLLGVPQSRLFSRPGNGHRAYRNLFSKT